MSDAVYWFSRHPNEPYSPDRGDGTILRRLFNVLTQNEKIGKIRIILMPGPPPEEGTWF